jgi:menaquinone reductase, molybdopterin-binding-like subunit
MSLKLTRREVLQFVGGSALGLLLTPVPWKVLDDTAIWSQNWPWIPKAQGGDISYASTTCTLCQSACGMRARLVGKQPVSLSGTAQHPFNSGALCTMGILAHHLRYHPARIKQPQKIAFGSVNGTPLALDSAMEEIARIVNGTAASGSVVILDNRPGRTASAFFRQLGESGPALRYLPLEAPALDVLHSMSEAPLGALGYDIDAARMILNFGAPLFDSWGTPSRAAKLLDARASRRQTIVHIEGMCSRSAERADQWIPARPGSETLVALSLANVIIEEKLFSQASAKTIADLGEFTGFIRAFTPESVSRMTGVQPDVIRNTARTFASQSPALAVVGNEAQVETRAAVMALNLLVGNIGRTGGIAVRNEIPNAPGFTPTRTRPVSFRDLPDHSIRVLILDESLSGCTLPDALLEKKLSSSGAVILSLAPFVTSRPYCTQYVIPSTVMFETTTDVTGPSDSAASSLAVSRTMLQAPDGAMDAVQFARALAQALGTQIAASGTSEELMKQRCAAIHASKRGTLFAPSGSQMTDVTALASADDLWTALADGGCWIDARSAEARTMGSFTLMNALRGTTTNQFNALDGSSLVVLPFAEMTVYDGKMISPLLCKVSQESGLRLALHQAYINPETAQKFALVSGETMLLNTKHGSMNVQAKIDASVMPDTIFVSTAGTRDGGGSASSAHDVRLLCDVSGSGTVSPTQVTIQKVKA